MSKNNNFPILFIATSPYSRMSKLNSVMHPLGIMSLASYTRENGFPNVKLIDRNSHPENEYLVSNLKKFKPKVIAIGAMNFTSNELGIVAKICKELLPDSLLVAGGPYISSSKEKALKRFPEIDIGVDGEGEFTLLEIIQNYQASKSLNYIQGTIVRRNGLVLINAPRPYIEDLDSLPDPAWDLVDLEFYNTRTSMSEMGIRPYMTIFSSRACPYRCNYCHSIFGKGFRALSAKRLITQIERIIDEFGIREFEFVDDIWNLDHKRLKEFCEIVIEKKLDIKWHFPNGVRGDIFLPGEITLMKEAGCISMSFAIESNNKRIQKETKKNLNIRRISRNIEEAKKAGVFSIGFFMIGFPNESLKEVLRTCWYIIKSPLCIAYISQPIPFEGTELNSKIDHLNGSLNEPHKSLVHNYSQISNSTLAFIMFITNVLFYCNPFRVYRILTTFPNLKLLVINLAKFFGLLIFRDDEFMNKLPNFIQKQFTQVLKSKDIKTSSEPNRFKESNHEYNKLRFTKAE